MTASLFQTTNTAAVQPHPLEICIASPEFVGLSACGPAGIASTAMAQALAAAGHKVTCLLLGAKSPSAQEWQRGVEKYKGDGLTLVALPQINASELVAPLHLIKSYEAYHWLKKNDSFDLIHFPERQGPGYHTLTAKHHGLAFARATICVGLQSMKALLQGAGSESMAIPAELDTDFMERRAVALADEVVGPEKTIIDFLPGRRQEGRSEGGGPKAVAPRLLAVSELVYFGTLEANKGAVLFCDALDSIPAGTAGKLRAVTFLGRESIIEGIPALNYVQKRAQHWPFPFRFVADLDQVHTMDFLRKENRLAVIPALREGSLDRVLDCLVAGIPFLASKVGGAKELIDPADADKICFEPNAGVLGAILCAVLAEGIRPARPAVESEASALRRNSPVRFEPAAFDLRATLDASAPKLSNDAAQAAIQALSIDPTDAIALKLLARLQLNAGWNEAAVEACQLILKNSGEDAEALQMMEEAKKAENIIDSRANCSSLEPRRTEPPPTFAAGFASPFVFP